MGSGATAMKAPSMASSGLWSSQLINTTYTRASSPARAEYPVSALSADLGKPSREYRM
jgi:hypothetical protein